MFHQVLEGACLAKFGHPGLAVFIGFKPVLLVPSGQQFRPLVADGGPVFK